jgi:16S rRNA (cytosine967-C5)-methyltransferase
MAAAARAAALRALQAIAGGRIDLGDALSRARDPLPDVRDRALATDLVTGTLRWQGAIDYQLQQRSRKPLARLDATVLLALRLGAYQLLHLGRIPPSAVVNDAVALVKQGGFASAAGFVNAILRRLARERAELEWPAREADPARHLAVVHSHPEWLVRRWIARYGEDTTEAWLQFNNDPPALTLSPNRLRASRDETARQLAAEGVQTRPTAIAPHGLVVTDGRALSTQAFARGDCVVQDEASQIVPELVAASRHDVVLDACAAPGGKTLALAAQSAPSGLIVATDVRRRRVALLRDTLTRCGVERARVVHIPDTGELPFREQVFTRVLVDAPCSGLGTIRRDPDIRWRRTAEDLPSLAAAQISLLRRIAPVVAVGGRLVYSTCSSEPEENEAVVAAFLEATPGFAVVAADTAAVDAVRPAIRRMLTPEGYLRTSPTHGLEAFFGAALTRRR